MYKINMVITLTGHNRRRLRLDISSQDLGTVQGFRDLRRRPGFFEMATGSVRFLPKESHTPPIGLRPNQSLTQWVAFHIL